MLKDIKHLLESLPGKVTLQRGGIGKCFVLLQMYAPLVTKGIKYIMFNALDPRNASNHAPILCLYT
jgi:hypothetical protein